jgi:anti-sigma-K factor RskA
MSQSHEELKSLIAPYVLGAVPADEEPVIRAHLLACDECRAEAEGFSVVTAKLALAADPVPLPGGFTERVIKQVKQGHPKHSAPLRRGRIFAALGAAAVLLLTAVLAFSLVTTRSDLAEEQRIVSGLLRTEEGLRLAADGVVGAVLPTEDGSLFVVEGLDDIPENRTYQLWFLEGEDPPVSAGTFEVDDGRAVLESNEDVEDFSGAAVTVEPEGGSPGPTTDPVLASG